MRQLFTFLAVLAMPVFAQQAAWYVLSREDGCMDLKVLARGERLPRAPVSPDDFAAMMRERGETVRIGPPPNFPPELAGKVVQVNVGSSKAPLFVRAEICRNIGK
jgi:hypothetical protein